MSDPSMPWVKVYTKMLDDPKLGRVSERVRWRFVQLLLMAGECDAEGYLVNGDKPMSTDDIAWRLRLDVSRCAADMASLENIGVVTNTERGWFLPKFGQLQGRSQSEKREVWRRNQAKARAKHTGPEWETAKNTGELMPVINDSDMSHTPRVEKSREEKNNTNGAEQTAPTVEADKPEPKGPLSVGQRQFLEAFGAKQFKTNIQRDAVLELEKKYGTKRLNECVEWASKLGMSVGKAIVSIESAIPNWGEVKPAKNGAGDRDAFKPGTVYT